MSESARSLFASRGGSTGHSRPGGKKAKPKAKRPALIEALEPRVLLAADGQPDAAMAVAIGHGLQEFANMLGKVTDPTASANTASIFDVAIPFVVQQANSTTSSNSPVTLRDLLGIDARNLGQRLDDAMDSLKPVNWQDIFNPSTGVAEFLDDTHLFGGELAKPTAQQFVDALNNLEMTANGVKFDIEGAGFTLTDNRIEFSGKFVFSSDPTYFVEPGVTAEQFGLTGQSAVSVPVDTRLEIGFHFGLDLSGTSPDTDVLPPFNTDQVFGINDNGAITNNDFFISIDSFKISVDIHETNIPDFDFNFGFLGTKVVDGQINLDIDVELKTLQSQMGFSSGQLQLSPEDTLTAANAPQSFTLTEPQTFDFKFGQYNPVEVTLAAGTYNSASALASALDTALNATSLGDFVHVDTDGGKIRFVADAFDASAMGFGNGNDELTGTTAVTGADITGQSQTLFHFDGTNLTSSSVEGYEFGTNQVFSVIVGDHGPIKVTLFASDTADNNVVDRTFNGTAFTDTLNHSQSQARLLQDINNAIDAALTAAGINTNVVDASLSTSGGNVSVRLTTATDQITVNERNMRLMPGDEWSGTEITNGSLNGETFTKTGSGTAVLPLQFALGSFTDEVLAPGADRPTVTLTIPDSFSNAPETISYSHGAAELAPFLNMTAQGFTSILDNIASALSAYSSSDIFDKIDVPFTENSLARIFDLGDFFSDTLLVDDRDDGLYSDTTVSNSDNDIAGLIDTEGKTTIKTAQDFVNFANSLLADVNVTPVYDRTGTMLNFQITMSGAIDPYTVGLNSAQSIGFVAGLFASKALMLSTGATNQWQQVLAQQFLPTNGVLTQDTTFVINVNHNSFSGPIAVTLYAKDTNDNATLNDLLNDLGFAMERARAGLGSIVGPSIVTDDQGNNYFLFTNKTNTSFSIDTRTQRALDFAFDLPISPMESVNAHGEWLVDGNMSLDFTLSLDLDPLGTGLSGNTFELTNGMELLGDLGLVTKTLPAIQAAGEPLTIADASGEQVYQLSADVTFTLKMTGESGALEEFDVTIEKADTATNSTLADLLADIKSALREAVDQNGVAVDVTTLVDVDISDGRIVFTASADGVDLNSFIAGSNVAALGFAGGTQFSNNYDLFIQTRSGDTFNIALDGLKTVDDLIQAVKTATGNKVDVVISTDKFALELVDKTSGDSSFVTKSVNGSAMAYGLGWVKENLPEIWLAGEQSPPPNSGGHVTANITVNPTGTGANTVVTVQLDIANGDSIGMVASKLAEAFAQGKIFGTSTDIDLGSLGVSAQIENGVLVIKGLGDKVESLTISGTNLDKIGYVAGSSDVVQAGDTIRGSDLHGDTYVVHASVSDMTLGGDYALSINPGYGTAPVLHAIAANALSDFSLAANVTVTISYTPFGSTTPISKALVLTAAATASNVTLSDLVADINALIANEGLDDLIQATSRAGKLVIEGLTSQVADLSVNFASTADAALLGYTGTANAAPIPGVVGSSVPTDYSPNSDLTFTVGYTPFGGSAVTKTLTLTAANAANNVTIADLVADLNALIKAQGFEDLIQATTRTGKIVFEGVDNLVRDLSVNFASTTNAAVLGYAATANAGVNPTPYSVLEGNLGFVGVDMAAHGTITGSISVDLVDTAVRLPEFLAAAQKERLDSTTPLDEVGLETTKTLTLTAAALANNTTLADLVADINALLAAQGLDRFIQAAADGTKLVFKGLTTEATGLSVDFASLADAALLGYATAENDALGANVVKADIALSDFSPSSDLTFTISYSSIPDTMRIVAGGAPASLNGNFSLLFTVVDTVDLMNTDYSVSVNATGNASLADLIADINTALANTMDNQATPQPLSDRFEAIIVDGKVTIAAKSSDVDILALRPSAGATMLGYVFPQGATALSGSLDDLRITLRDGTIFTVMLDGAQTIGDVLHLIKMQQPSADLFDVAIDDDAQRLVFRDLTTPAAGGEFKIENINGSAIGSELGIVTSTTSGEIASTKLIDAYQVRSVMDAAPTLTQGGTVTFDIGYDSRLVVPTMTMGPAPKLTVNFTGGGSLAIAGDFRFTNPAYTATFTDLLKLQNLTYEDVIIGISDVVDFIANELAQHGAVNDNLPIFDQSLRDLFDFVSPFKKAETEFQRNVLANNIQGVQMALAAAMSQVDSTITFVLDGNVLKGEILFTFASVAPQSIGIDVDAQLLPSLPGSREFGGRAGIPFVGQAQLDVDFGIDLATPSDVYLYETTKFSGSLFAQSPELAFLASVGPFALLARSAEVYFRNGANTPATFEIRVTDGNAGNGTTGRVKVADADKTDVTASITGDFEAFVPLFLKDGATFVGIVEFDGTLAFKADGSGFDQTSWAINMPPVLTGADPTFAASFSIFDNFTLLVEGLDQFLLNVQDLLDGPRGLGVTLPLGGDELVEAGFFIEPIRAWAIEKLFALADTLVISDEAGTLAAINAFLTGTAFDVQVFGKDVTVAIASRATDADGDGDYDRIEWDVDLSQQNAKVDRIIPLDALVPALQMEVTGFLEVLATWDFSFTMFLDAVSGFGIDVTGQGAADMHVALDVHLPVDGTTRITMPDGRIGLFKATFTDSRNATVITSITAENLFNLGQTISGDFSFTLSIDKTKDGVYNPTNYTVTVKATDLQAGIATAGINSSALEYAINEALAHNTKNASGTAVDISGDVAAQFLDGRFVLTTNGITVENMTVSGANAAKLGFVDGQKQESLYTYFKPEFTMDLYNAADTADGEMFYGDLDNLTMHTTVAATDLSDLPDGVAINQIVGSLIYNMAPGDFTFKVALTKRSDGSVEEYSINVTGTGDNGGDINKLLTDVQNAIAGSGAAGKITAVIEDGHIVLKPVSGDGYKKIEMVEGGKPIGFTDGQYAHVAPNGAAIAILALDIDTEGAVAQGFLPGVYSKIDIVYALNNVPLVAIETPDDPGMVTGIVSLKFGETIIEVSDLLDGLDQVLSVFETLFGNPAIETILKMLFNIPGISDLAGAPIGLIDLGFIFATYQAAKDGKSAKDIEKIVKRYENAKIFYAFVQSLVQLSRAIKVDRGPGGDFAPFIHASSGFDLTEQLSTKDFRLANVPTIYAKDSSSGFFSYSVGSQSSKVDISKRQELFSGHRQFSDDKVDLAKQLKMPEKPKADKDGNPPKKPELARSKAKDTVGRLAINDFGEGIDVPILTDAENQVIKMLLGVHGNIFGVDIPTVTIENAIEWKMSFFAGPIPLMLTIKLMFNVKIDFAFGWDTGGFYFSDTGLPTGNGADAGSILVGNSSGLAPKQISKLDVPELSFQFIARVELGIGIPGISISIGAEIGFLINLDFHDANKDGKVQGPELAVGPTDISMQITVTIFLKFTFLFFEQKINLISLKFDLFEHDNVTPFVAADMTNGLIRLNMGEFSWARFDGDLTDGEERWVITGNGDDIVVQGYLNGVLIGMQSFSNVTKIIAFAGLGNDTIDMSGLINSQILTEIHLGIGNDTFIGAASVASGSANYGRDIVYGEDGNDTLRGGGGNDVLIGGAGMDWLEGEGGNDALFGDTGLAVFKLPTYLGGDNDAATPDLFRARVTGRDDSDTILGGDGDDVIFGGGGKTSQVTSATLLPNLLASILTGTDLIDGGAGSDLIFGDAGTVTYKPGQAVRAEDSNRGKGSSDIIAGGAGGDTIFGGRGDDFIFGQLDNDIINGDRGRDFIEGGEGADTMDGGYDDDIIYGDRSELPANAGGDDVLLGNRGNDKIYGQKGDDYIDGGQGDDVLYGQEDSDRILGGRGVDFIFGGAGTDYISGGAISDIIFGDDGLIVYLNRFINDSGNLDNLNGNAADLIFKYYGEGDLSLVDSSLLGDRTRGSYDLLATDNAATDGDDYISGGDGDDVVFGGSGNDTIGGDLDVAVIGGPLDAVSTPLPPAYNAATMLNTSGRDTLIGDGALFFYNLFAPKQLRTTLDSGGNDTLYGNRGEDIIVGGMGNDLAYGGHGDFTGAPEIDPSDTESDRDIMFGDNVVMDFTVYPFQPSGKLTQILSTDTSTATAGNDTLYGDAHDDIIVGGLGADNLTGGRSGLPNDVNDGGDIIFGDNALVSFNTTVNIAFRDRYPIDLVQSVDPLLGANDTIFGSGGDDVLIGGAGADIISGHTGGDVAFGDEGIVDFVPTKITIPGLGGGMVDLYKGEQIGSGRTLDTMTSAGGADTINGGDGDDILFGGVLNDRIFGDAGNDIVFGDIGRYQLTTGIPGTLRERATLLESFDPLGDLSVLPDLSARGNDADTITGDAGDDILFGGFGGDNVSGNADNDVALGDNGRIELAAGGIVTRLLTTDKANGTGGTDTVSGDIGNDVVVGGVLRDFLFGNEGDDIAVGDNVDIRFFLSGGTSYVQSIQTIDAALGGDDDIRTDDNNAGDGNDIALGGFGADEIRTYGLKDVAVGDNGRIAFATGVIPTRAFMRIETTNTDVGGDDTIDTGADNDMALGGAKNDTILLGAGEDIALGDEGLFDFLPGLGGLPRLSMVVTVDAAIGGTDTIKGEGDADLIVGGAKGDRLEGGDANDIMFGDNAVAHFDNGVLNFVSTIADTIGDSDILIDGLGDDIVVGGAASETIVADPGRNIIFGDTASANFEPGGGFITSVRVTVAQTTDPFAGADDTLIGNDEDDVLVGGAGNDFLDGRGGSDAMTGDAGRVFFYENQRYRIIETPYIYTGGNDTLIGGPGNDFMFGGFGFNFFFGNNIEDLMFGSSGRVELARTGFVTRIDNPGFLGMDIITADLFGSYGVDPENYFENMLSDVVTTASIRSDGAGDGEGAAAQGGTGGVMTGGDAGQRSFYAQMVPLPQPRPDNIPQDQPPPVELKQDVPPLENGLPQPPPLLKPTDPDNTPVGTVPEKRGDLFKLDFIIPDQIDTARVDQDDQSAGGDILHSLAGAALGVAAVRGVMKPSRRKVQEALDDGDIIELNDETGSWRPVASSIEWRAPV